MPEPPYPGPSARSERIRELFERALDASPGARAALIDAAAAPDPGLAREVRQLLEAFDGLGDRLATLDTAAAARLLDETAPDPLEQGRIGRFEVVRRIGRGGMGVVYLGYDPELDRHVALKVMSASTLGDDATAARLLHEARATSRLDHPCIATVYDVGRTEDGRLFMAMAYYPGRTLAERIAEGPLSADRALDIAKQVADALAAAHAAGIVHRDVKPANVMLLPDGSVRVLDFGVARLMDATLTRAGATLGTVAYMSPEQTRGAEVDGRSDLWALGVVLHEMLTGGRPFAAGSETAVIHRIRHDAPDMDSVPRDAPPGLRAIVERCLAKEPDERFPDAASLAAALDGAAAPTPHRPGAGPAWTPVAVGAAALVAALSLVPLVGSGGDVHPAASVLAVLPVTPAVEDSALARIGRELAVTVAMNLDGMGGVRVMDPLTVLCVLEPLAHLERVHVERALDRPDRARWHLDRALEHLDAPDAPLRTLVEEGARAVEGTVP
ncbi:MAG TPA: serine/threonine-protein kinase [Longimicrobiales bacterium]|nr:serine/threonine-protein kinase [Longimicrobiales bacterium]